MVHRKIIQFILKYLWITVESGNGKHRLNLFNPLSYVAVFAVALFYGIVAFCSMFCDVITDSIHFKKR
jgi:hypothetical protein